MRSDKSSDLPSVNNEDAQEISRLSNELLLSHASKDTYGGGWDYSGDCIIEARDSNDLELLRIYGKLVHPAFSNGTIGKVTHVVSFMRRNGYTDIAATLTEEHIFALVMLEDELAKRTVSVMVARYLDPRHDPLRVIMIENFHRKELFFGLIKERNIVDGVKMREVLAQMDSNHSSLAVGTL